MMADGRMNVVWTINNTRLETWFERDRACVRLVDLHIGETIVEWLDEAVDEAVRDGFLDASGFIMGREVRTMPLFRSAVDYANSIGAALPAPRRPRKGAAPCGFRLAGMMPPCVLPKGHSGDHSDGFGGHYGATESAVPA